MRLALATFSVSLIAFGAVGAFTQLIANSRYLDRSSAVLRDWALRTGDLNEYERSRLIQTALDRVMLYDELANRSHLVDGMLVNRTVHGSMLDQCDSLLFSSLRFVGLTKLGFQQRAVAAWEAIARSKDQGRWVRHPRCRSKGTSRDMLLGLLTALSQEPDGAGEHVRSLMRQVAESGGYFGHGPIYVSYLTPGVAKLIAMVALANELRPSDLPPIFQNGYSTSEWTLYATKRGYQAHLVALNVWLERELVERHPSLRFGERSQFETGIDAMVRPFAPRGVLAQRAAWTTHNLVQLDKRNLFFRYLRLRVAGALTPPVAARLLNELLAMPQFPKERLPNNCDRRADYLWQRDSGEYRPSARTCSRVYNGADFVWMAGLLVEAMAPHRQALLSH